MKALKMLVINEVDNPDTAISKRGMVHFEECYEKCKKVFGEFHQETLDVLHSIGLALVDTEREEDSMAKLTDCLKLRRQYLGEKHPDTLESLNRLTNIYDDKEEYGQAEPLYEECLLKRRDLLVCLKLLEM